MVPHLIHHAYNICHVLRANVIRKIILLAASVWKLVCYRSILFCSV